MSAKILVIDNYDSFTYNLVAALREQGVSVDVRRNDAISAEDAMAGAYSHLLISPGPGRPDDAGVSIALIDALAGRIPILGVCLGHQCIVQAFGGEIVHAERLMHGKYSDVQHDGSIIYQGVSQPLKAGRYHSLAASSDIPQELLVTGQTARGEIMSVQHRKYAIVGVQFHPESVLTPEGPTILGNFIAMREPAVEAA